MTQLYTNSRLRVLRECLRKHFYVYVLRIKTPETFVMAFGTALHKCLEAYLLAWKADADREARLAAALAAVPQRFPESEQRKLRVLCIAYDARWGTEEWEILEVEREFRYELDDNLIGGKLDGLIRDRTTGRVYVLEHKSTGADVSPGSPYWEKLAIDSQVSIYIDGAAILGHSIAGCIYDVIKRPEHEPLLATPADKREYTQGKGCKLCGGNLQGKQGTGTSTVTESGKCAACKGTGWRIDKEGKPEEPRLYAKQRERDETLDEFEDRLAGAVGERIDEFLIRNIVVRLDDELPRMRESLLQTIALERVTSATKLYVQNTDACARYSGQMCSFFAACSGRASIDDEILFPRSESAHPELASAA